MWIYIPDTEVIAHPVKCTCGASIIFVTTKAGAKMPIDPAFKIEATQTFGEVELLEVDNKYSHFVSCPNAKSFRQKAA